MNTGEPLRVTRDGAVATVVLDRAGVLNALDPAMASALAREARRLAADPAVRCIVVTGAGGHFMAGGDIGYFGELLALPPPQRRARVAQVLEDVHGAVRSFEAAPKPVLASVRGACAGFGMSLMMACDLAIVAADATLSLAYCRIGASPDGGATWNLPRLVGARRAMALALLGDRVPVSDALAMGLVNRVVPDDELDGATVELARRLADGPAAAMARSKRLLRGAFDRDLHAQLAAEAESFLDGIAGDEFEEGVRAFLEKRSPRFAATPEPPA